MKTTIITLLIIYILKNLLFVIFKILTRSKDRGYSDFTAEELKSGFEFMQNSITNNVNDRHVADELYKLLYKRWQQFKDGEFKVDGATFVSEQEGNYFNLWWFNHDARNKYGYVGTEIDNEMLTIMILLNVPQSHFRDIIPWFSFTWINTVRHILTGNRKNELPNDLIRIN